MTTRHLLLLAIVAGGQAIAQEPDANRDENATRALDTITVIGTRTERALDEVAAHISVIQSEDLERELARDIADLVRYEPGVSVGGSAGRFGLEGFTLRGIGGNRVLTLVDGVRVPEEFSFGPFLSARRDFVDIDSLNRAEIARGPISSLYGSDALGGVVAFTTKGPRDYLADADYYAGFKGGYSGADESAVGGTTLALGNQIVSGMLHYTRRDASETENQGSVGGTGPTRELPDPQDFASDNVVAKISFHPNDTHEFTFGVDRFENETSTHILSDYGVSVFGTTVDRRDANDERSRTRVSLRYEFEGELTFADSIQTTVYHQTSETEQRTSEDRTTAAAESQTRQRASFFDQDIEGAYVQFGKQLELGGSDHFFTYGIDYYTTESAGLRDGGTFDSSGNPLPEFAPLPTRDFPPTEVEQFAIYLQDEISLLGDRLLLSPGIRYDSFDAETAPDDIYLSGNPGSPLPEDYDDAEVTARIGAVFAFTDAVSAYAHCSEGVRAPPYDDVNVGFTNFIGGYKTISNPNLRSETSRGLELGLRLQGDSGSLSLGLFRTDYDDFIESFAIAPEFLASGGIDPADGLLTFQSINRDEVEIKGAEMQANLEIGEYFSALEGFSLRTAIAYAEGDDKATGQPINSIEPLTGVLGIGYTSRNDRWGTELVWTLVDGKDQNDIDANNPRITTAGYGIVDLLAYVQVNDRISVNAGLFNVGDKPYIRWADTAGIGGDAPARFTQPGFNAGVTVRVEL